MMGNETTAYDRDEQAMFRLRALYDRYGYARFRMSKFEEYDLYVRNKSFLLSDHIITFTDTSGKLMALKPDVTLSIVKNSKDGAAGVQKVYYNENVYRISKGGHGFSEIMQIGLECIGKIDRYCIAEVVMLAAASLGEISQEFVLDVSHMGLLSAVLDGMGVCDEDRGALIACVGEKNAHGIAAICEKAGVNPEPLLTLVSSYGAPSEVLPALRGVVTNEAGRAALCELSDTMAVLSGTPFADRVRVDFSVVNDLSYYNGIVFKGFIKGIPTGVLSGGQYDLLMQKMGKRSGAIGFAVYPDELEELTEAPKAYDVDAVLLYDEGADLGALFAAVERMTAEGMSVSAQRSLPEKLRCRQVLRWKESGVEILEDHA